MRAADYCIMFPPFNRFTITVYVVKATSMRQTWKISCRQVISLSAMGHHRTADLSLSTHKLINIQLVQNVGLVTWLTLSWAHELFIMYCPSGDRLVWSGQGHLEWAGSGLYHTVILWPFFSWCAVRVVDPGIIHTRRAFSGGERECVMDQIPQGEGWSQSRSDCYSGTSQWRPCTSPPMSGL